jgi:hypothetical protein
MLFALESEISIGETFLAKRFRENFRLFWIDNFVLEPLKKDDRR